MTEEEKAMTEMPKIDMTKIANIDALSTEDKKLFRGAARKAQKNKFCFTESMPFPLPSGGKFYQDADDEDLRNGIIHLHPMSLSEEEILTNKAYIKNNSLFRVLFDACMDSNYPANKILSFDSLYIMYVLRQISYGDDYHFNIKCDDCGEEHEVEINISDIDWKELDADVKEEYEIKLPVSKFTVTMLPIRRGMEEQQEIIKKKNKDSPFLTDQTAILYSNTTSIKDASGEELPPGEWLEFYAALPTRDKNEINKTFKPFAQNPKITITCPNCGNVMTMSVPMEADFFRISE